MKSSPRRTPILPAKEAVMKRILVFTTITLIVAASIFAGERAGREERGELAQYLGLTADQRAAWDNARTEFGANNEALFQKEHTLMQQVEAALKNKSSDACGLGNSMIAAQAVRDQLRTAREALIQKQVSVLTPEQKTKYDAFVAARGGEGEMRMRHE
jgi:Spy/CpxP family protein refolding chaperone